MDNVRELAGAGDLSRSVARILTGPRVTYYVHYTVCPRMVLVVQLGPL